MKRYSVVQVRERLAEALDEADRGVPVIIERRGTRYRLSVERPASSRRKTQSRIEVVDDAISGGQWTWASSKDGLGFVPRRLRR